MKLPPEQLSANGSTCISLRRLLPRRQVNTNRSLCATWRSTVAMPSRCCKTPKLSALAHMCPTPQASAGSPAPRPQTSAPAAPTRRPRRLRWAFVLGLFILAGFFVAERSNDFRRALDSIVDPSSRPAISNRAAAPTTVAGGTGRRSALPTPKVEGRGEVFYTKTRANARACAKLSCKVLDVLNPGDEIVAQRYAKGERVNGSDAGSCFVFAVRTPISIAA